MYNLPSRKYGLQKIVLGNLPLIGISYQGREKDKEYEEKFSRKEEMKRVMKVALDHGIRSFAASSQDFNELATTHLKAIQELEQEEEVPIRLIVCVGIPLKFKGTRVNDYKRWKTHLSYETDVFGRPVIDRVLEDPILNCRQGWKRKLRAATPYKLTELERELTVDWRLWEDRITKLCDYRVSWIEPGSETDLLAISRMDLLEELLDRSYEFGYRTLLGSHHIGATVPLIREVRVNRFDGYVTPVNTLGIMMYPTQQEAETACMRIRKEGKLLIAIKPFAGGRIKPKEALNYVYKSIQVDSCMMGVGSIEEAEEDFRIGNDILVNSN